MNKHNLNSILKRYAELQPEGGKPLTPRPGFYYIQEVTEEGQFVRYHKAVALWKEHASDNFYERAVVEIQLTSLKESSPIPATFDPESLVGQVIHVTANRPKEISINSLPRTIVICEWHLDDSPFIIDRDHPNGAFWELLQDAPKHSSVSDIIGEQSFEEPELDDDFFADGNEDDYYYADGPEDDKSASDNDPNSTDNPNPDEDDDSDDDSDGGLN